MATAKAQTLIQNYEANTWLIGRHAEGLTHAESLLQPTFAANCFNWVLGHIIWRRNSALLILGQDPFWSEEMMATYRSGSDPIQTADGARELASLLEDLTESQQRIGNALQQVSAETLATVVETDRGNKAVGEYLASLHWHETYHVGQLDLLRAMALSRRNDSGRTPVGAIIWRDLTVQNAEEIQRFYSRVVGWQARPHDMGEYHDFDIIAADKDEVVAGICNARGHNANLPSQWLIYVWVADVDESARRCVELGGKVVDGPRTMGDSRFCVIQDPAGAVAGLISQ